MSIEFDILKHSPSNSKPGRPAYVLASYTGLRLSCADAQRLIASILGLDYHERSATLEEIVVAVEAAEPAHGLDPLWGYAHDLRAFASKWAGAADLISWQ